MIAGPSTATEAMFTLEAGSVSVKGAGSPASVATQCLTDTFSIPGTGATTPPVICGKNSGHHSKSAKRPLSLSTVW